MVKAVKKQRRQDNEAFAKARYIKGSERKLNLVAQLIRGKTAQRALIDLEFSPRRVSREVKKVLEAAIANAENNHNLDVDRLIVKEAYVGKTMVMARFRARGRGRSAKVEKPFSNITIVVQEKAAGEEPKKAKKAKGSKKEGEKTAKKAAAKKAPAAKKAAKQETEDNNASA
ncbi:MAG: 50S ribosomal protein L22 [Alphaproteobacteria bacterium]|nr:50S ribosomal protein L22 [Alphaproteobacteria bacterium]